MLPSLLNPAAGLAGSGGRGKITTSVQTRPPWPGKEAPPTESVIFSVDADDEEVRAYLASKGIADTAEVSRLIGGISCSLRPARRGTGRTCR